MDGAGNLYGATEFGGTMNGIISVCGVNGCGVAFELTRNLAQKTWTYSVLYTFCQQLNCADGFGPGDLTIDTAGNLYGNAGGGKGGVIFKLTPNQKHPLWAENVIYSFCSRSNCADGDFPGTLSVDGENNILGTTLNGGNAVACPGTKSNDPGCGIVFKLTADQGKTAWTETVIYSFCSQSNCADGGFPSGGRLMTDAGGNFYGMTSGAPYTMTIAGGNYGTVFKISAAGVPLSKNPVTADFNADHKSDILLQNTEGAVAIWEMDGAKKVASGGSGNPGAGWRAVGAGYFWGSPYVDILLQNLSGAVQIWQMNGWKKVGGGVVGTPAASWHAIGTGDFNGDGYSDILWQNTNGAVAIWEMNGTKVVGSATIGNPGTAWHAIGAGDFNGDGKSDILFQNTNGAVAVWEMNGLKVLASATVGNPGTAWHVVGSGDFNRDGYADILFQNANGAVAIWEMNGLKRIGGGSVGNPGATWHVVGTGDYNGDGYSDILLQNANGAVEIWEMDGTKITKSGSPGNPGPAWHAIGE